MTIYFDDGFDINSSLTGLMERAGDACLKEEGLDSIQCTVSCTFVDKDEIQRLNKGYRGQDKVTDVLSFPQYATREEIPAEGDVLLGDVVICAEVAAEQAEAYGHSQMRELLYLFTHSILHLIGYDHMDEDEKKVMREKEEKVMELIGLPREN